MARSNLCSCRLCRNHWIGPVTGAAAAGAGDFAGPVLADLSTCSSLDRSRAGRLGRGSCRRAVGDQPAGCGGRAAVPVANLIFGLGGDCDVGGVCVRHASGRPSPAAAAPDDMAPGAYGAWRGDRRRNRRACLADPRHDGNMVQAGSMCVGGGGDGFGVRRPQAAHHPTALKALRDHGFLDCVRRFEPAPNEGRGPQVRQISNAYRLSAPKRALALLGRWAGQPSVPDDDQAARKNRVAMEAEHVETLDLAGLAVFKIERADLAKALELMGKAIDLRESAERTKSQSTSFSYA